MMKDQQIMALIGAMQNDQELQVLLSDPTILRAIQVGDVSTLSWIPMRTMQSNTSIDF
jgi:hypothetical protein